MAQYKVMVEGRLEVGGIVRNFGEVLDESVFAPAPEVTEGQKADGIVSHPSEIESLLSTGHIELI